MIQNKNDFSADISRGCRMFESVFPTRSDWPVQRQPAGSQPWSTNENADYEVGL